MIKAFPSLPPGWIKARLYHLIAPLAALVLVWVLNQVGFGQGLETLSINLRFQARAPFDPPADSRLIFLGVDQQSLDKFGKWSWRRKVIADFLNNVAAAQKQPNTIAFDIIYSEPSLDHPEDDQAFGDAAAKLPSVITGAVSVKPSSISTTNNDFIKEAEVKTKEELKEPGYTLPFTQIQGDVMKINGSNIATLPVTPIRTQSFFAFVNDDPSQDGIRHVIPLVLRLNGQIYPSLALQTLCQMLGVDADKVVVNVGQNVVLKNASGQSWTIPMNEQGEYAINYRRNSSFKAYSFGRVFDALDDNVKRGTPMLEELNIEKKILVFGENATALGDNGPTPLQGESPLPYTHLDVINNVLQNDYLSFVPLYWVIIGWSLVTWPTLLRLKDAPLGEAILMPAFIVTLYIFFAFGIFWLKSVQITLAWPVLSYVVLNFGGVVMRWREERRGKEQIKNVFSRMLSPEVMDHLLDHPENIQMGGSERPVTILFSDIRDYTKFSEGLSAAEVVRQLNLYFERMVPCVIECQGTLHKFIGDAIMAAWGDIGDASQGSEKDAQNAVRCALMMRAKLRVLNEERKAAGLIPFRIGIGLNYGKDVIAGLMGASSRSEFTVMGDAVNVASRLEGVTKDFHTDLAISDSVRDLIGDDFLVRRLGLIQLKGKSRPTVVFEVLATKANVGDSKIKPEIVARYEEAFDHFLARRFTEAEAGFIECQKMYPDDYCINEYLATSREFAAKPPPPEWDGRIVMETK